MRWLIALLFLLPGCTEETQDPPEPMPDAETGPQNVTLYLHPDGSLAEAVPADAEQSIDWGYQQWLDGTPPPAWTAEPVPGWRVVSGDITLVYRAEQATSGADVRPELTAWWGSDTSIYHHVFIDGPDSLQAGEVVEATSALSIPEGGFVQANGSVPLVRIGSYYADGPQTSTMTMLMGEGKTRLDLVIEPVAWPALVGEEALSATGTLTGSRCTVSINPTEAADSYHDVEIGADVRGMEVRVRADDLEPTSDLDLVIYGPNGTVVGGGHSSFDIEGADVWWDNLAVDGPGTYTIRVLACTFQTGSYDLDVTLYR